MTQLTPRQTGQLADLKAYVDRLYDEDDEIDLELSGRKKLEEIIASYSDDFSEGSSEDILSVVRSFENSAEVSRQKLYVFCNKMSSCPVYSDGPGEKALKNCGEVLHGIDFDDELKKVFDFVKAHASDKTFGDTVYQFMGEKGLTAPEVYKAAKLSRQDFSRITDPRCKGLKKSTVWNVIIGLRLDIDEADELLFSAGYSRTNGKFDLILTYAIENKIYSIFDINVLLEELGQKTLAFNRSVADGDAF